MEWQSCGQNGEVGLQAIDIAVNEIHEQFERYVYANFD